MDGSILIVSHGGDVHAAEVLARLRQRGIEPILLDTGRVPSQTRLTIAHDPADGWGAWATIDGRELDLARVKAVWWRRPLPFTLDAAIGGPEDRHFALSETHAAVSGLWSLLDAAWINDPDRDERAGRKAYQLAAARSAGLAIPRTCITSDPQRARAFVAAEGGAVIYKTFTATEATWRETRLLREHEAEALDAVRFAPVIFQQHVAASADLRVTVVGDAIFAAAIRVPRGAYPYDFRMTMGAAEITAHELPESVAHALRKLMRALGLVYGAIDLRLTAEGEHVFLEVNPAGQWLFVEQATGQPISEAIAAALAQRAGATDVARERPPHSPRYAALTLGSASSSCDGPAIVISPESIT